MVLIIDLPWILSSVMSFILTFLDPVVASKIKFIKEEDLIKHIDKTNLPEIFGGDLKYEYEYIPPTNYELDKLKELKESLN